MNISRATTAQGRQNEVVAAYISRAMENEDACQDCGGTLRNREQLIDRWAWDRTISKPFKFHFLLCEECVPVCALENDCGQPQLCGGQGGCQTHEIAMWISELGDTSDPIKRMEILNCLMDLGWESKVSA